MRKLTLTGLVFAALALSACAATNPEAPDLRGSVVEPMNPSKWDYEDAVRARQEALANLPSDLQ